MAITAVQGSFALIEGRIFWNGQEVLGIESILIHSDEDVSKIKLEVANGDEALLTAMEAGGIKVRRI